MIETSVLFRRLAQFFQSGAVPFEKVRNMLFSEKFLFKERSRFPSHLAGFFFCQRSQISSSLLCVCDSLCSLMWRILSLNAWITKDKCLTVSVRCQSLYSFVSGYQMLQTSNMTWGSLSLLLRIEMSTSCVSKESVRIVAGASGPQVWMPYEKDFVRVLNHLHSRGQFRPEDASVHSALCCGVSKIHFVTPRQTPAPQRTGVQHVVDNSANCY